MFWLKRSFKGHVLAKSGPLIKGIYVFLEMSSLKGMFSGESGPLKVYIFRETGPLKGKGLWPQSYHGYHLMYGSAPPPRGLVQEIITLSFLLIN